MQPPRLWCRLTTLDADGRVSASEAIEGPGSPDMGVVDLVARRALAAARGGGRLALCDVDPELVDLLRLAGLPVEAVGAALEVGGLAVDVDGQPEGGEEPLGVQKGQEEGHLGDLPA